MPCEEGRWRTGYLVMSDLISLKHNVWVSVQNLRMSGDFCLPQPFPLEYWDWGLILDSLLSLLDFFKMSFIGLIKDDSLGRNCERKITQPINDLIPRAVIGNGRFEIEDMSEPKGIIVGLSLELDSKRPMYLTECLEVCILLRVSKDHIPLICVGNILRLTYEWTCQG